MDNKTLTNLYSSAALCSGAIKTSNALINMPKDVAVDVAQKAISNFPDDIPLPKDSTDTLSEFLRLSFKIIGESSSKQWSKKLLEITNQLQSEEKVND